MVYLAEHPALAVLEVRVHLDLPPDLLPGDYVLLPAELPDGAEVVADLPADPRAFGDEWLRSGRSAVLQVPSIIVPQASNLLLNPRHPAAGASRAGTPQPFRFDARLWTP